MQRHDAKVAVVLPKRGRDKLLFPVLGVFAVLVALAGLFVRLDQVDERRFASGMVAAVRHTASQSWTTHEPVILVKLDDGSVVKCDHLPNYGVGSRVKVSIGTTRVLRRKIVEC